MLLMEIRNINSFSKPLTLVTSRIRGDTPVPSTNDDEPIVYRTLPDLVLPAAPCCEGAPTISIAWTEYCGSSKLAAVSASGIIFSRNQKNICSRKPFYFTLAML